METSESIVKISAALVKAQGKLQPALKTAKNEAFKRNGKASSYATLHDCITTAQPVLAECELAIVGGICGHEYVARLIHSSGEWFQNRIPLPSGVSTAQQLIAAQTYFRRASYALINLSADEDDDGNEANKLGNFGKPAAAVGIGVHSPLGDTKPSEEAVQYATCLAKAVVSDDLAAIKGYAADLKNEGEEMYRNVWALLDSKTRSRIKSVLATKEAA
jgi:hypothetical protein